MKIILNVILLLIAASNIFAQNLNEEDAKQFINHLINNSDELINYVEKNELTISERLGISYPEVKFKFLISNDPDSMVKVNIRNNSLKYDFTINHPDDIYSILTVNVPSKKFTTQYFFHNRKLISKPFYYAKEWVTQKSRFFDFHLSKINLINKYAIARLDSFVANSIALLKLDKEEITHLEKEKIHYFLCGDENEIEQLTGYKARGLYYLPYDYIISTYNSHYHEVLHLLMNYKLKNVPLYTLPFLQEGFAAGIGGRGGLDAKVILDMGYFLSRSGFLDYNSLLSKADFNQVDASMSYPVAGLYTNFLINDKGINKFIEFYRKYSADVNSINNIIIDTTDLPQRSEWNRYLQLTQNSSIKVKGFSEADFKVPVIESEQIHVYESEDEYLFKLKSDAVLNPTVSPNDYKSNLFNEILPGKSYKGEKYIIKASVEEVSLYNILNNVLLVKYVKGFSEDNTPVMQKDGFFLFTIKKDLFDEPLRLNSLNTIH